jgi:NAD(P)-dependent dehydrogenase (short-subunit alcohol dehydrogenase family)
MRLAGKRAMVTGGADGLGRAIVEAFSREGAKVMVLDRDEGRACELVQACAAIGRDVRAYCGSVADEGDVAAAFEQMDVAFGGVDVLVNNAGVNSNQPSATLAAADWDRVMSVNLRGPFLCAQQAGRRMTAQGGGSIVNIASIFGVVAAPNRVAYCVSKSGVAMMAKVLAVEWASAGIRVNAIAPGYVETAQIGELVRTGRIDLRTLRERTPMKRLGEPAEIAELAIFVSSDAASYITGQVLGIDGGWTAYGYI